jgi:hypothetical protein
MSAVDVRRWFVESGERTLGDEGVKWAVCMKFEMPINVGRVQGNKFPELSINRFS